MMSRARLPRLWLWLPLALAPLLSGPAVQVSGARILAAVPMRSASHFRVLQPLLRALAHRGHHLTVISHFPQQPPPPNYTDISLNSAATHGRAPSPYMGNPDHPAYMENFFLSMVAPLGFWERTANSAFYLLMRLANWWLSERVIDEVERAALGSALPPTSRLVYNTSLMLLNSHFSLNQPIPLVPAMIEVGGLHIEQPKPLPKELQEFFDSSEHGVVYFSMGTMLRVDALPQEQLRGILRAFASLPQKVLWKADHTLLPPLPPNVHTSEWLPQNDILNHPKTVAFVTHGGMLGLQEAVAAGVPMLVVPVLGDQPHNAASLSSRGVALTLTVNQLTEHNVRHALDSLVNDTSYRKRMKQLSALFRDRPRPPLEEAVYWVEYVIRHRGAPHLRSAALDLAWYQYLLLDVAALVLATVLLALASVYAGLRWILGPLLVGNRAQRKKIKSN
ncbi:UDP-glucosyltransferase 2-like isoform X2 [Schistocerca gregaria]|uniref:UDP-glucosyltransferase 2-like isoform X2 n=1 Tax=Schistocerca gregaria TaxID=7010 RepID=UPI00211E725C|nr:UDP-glucosyltransferase 2-like isoform X2 [Schistocerca gregaria]XP_049832177.1 UDP-glucosyltransferase 2-like isoform X2 [Schistocerca gregaria]